MVSLTSDCYYLDDWDKINAITTDFVSRHKDQIEVLEEWLKKEPHLPMLNQPTLGLFLNLSNKSCEGAKESIEAYFTHKSRHQEQFADRMGDIKKMNQVLDLFEVSIPDVWERGLNGDRLVFFRIVDEDASKLDFHIGMKIFTSCLDFEIARAGHGANNMHAVIDASMAHLGFLTRINVMEASIVLKYIMIIENLVSSVHVVNCNSVVTQVMTLIRPFLSKLLLSKIHFYSPNQLPQLYDSIPKSCLPSNYGGEMKSMTELNDIFRKRFRAAEDYIKMADSQEYLVKENLRRVSTGCETMTGSFRKLIID